MPRVQLALAAVFFTLAAPLQLEDASLYWGLTWCIEGLVFSAVGLYFRDRQLRWTALAVFTIAAVRTLCFDYLGPTQLVTTLAIDQRFSIIGLTAAVAMAAGSLYWAIPHALGEASGVISVEDDRSIRYEGAGLVAAGNLLLLLAMTCQWHDRTVLFLWTLDAAIIWLAGFYFHKAALRWYGCILGVGLVGCRILYHHMQIDPAALPIANARFISLVCVALLYFVVSGMYRRQNQRSQAEKPIGADERPLADILGVLANVLLLAAVSLEIDHRFDLWRSAGQSPFANMRMVEMAAYSIVWAVYASALVAIGFALRNRLFRLIGLVAFGPILVKVFFLDLAHLELLPRVLALAVVGMALLGVSFLYQKFAARVGV